MINAGLMSSGRSDWNTPEEVLDLVRQLGAIRLDPCSNATSIVAATVQWDGREVDGLRSSWAALASGVAEPPRSRFGRQAAFVGEPGPEWKAMGAEIRARIIAGIACPICRAAVGEPCQPAPLPLHRERLDAFQANEGAAAPKPASPKVAKPRGRTSKLIAHIESALLHDNLESARDGLKELGEHPEAGRLAALIERAHAEAQAVRQPPTIIEQMDRAERESRDPLTIECPSCHMKPGERCRNYKGKGCASHRQRIAAARAP